MVSPSAQHLIRAMLALEPLRLASIICFDNDVEGQSATAVLEGKSRTTTNRVPIKSIRWSGPASPSNGSRRGQNFKEAGSKAEAATSSLRGALSAGPRQ